MVKRDVEPDVVAVTDRGDSNADAAGSKACAAVKPSWAKNIRVVKWWASREYIRSPSQARPPFPNDIATDDDEDERERAGRVCLGSKREGSLQRGLER